jgi:DNA-binding SARP family transcriptional activator
MEFRILGPLEVVEDGHPVPVDRRLSRALLAYLLLHANEPVSSDRLVDQLWGEKAPKTAVASLQNYVSRLRKSIGSERLRLEAAGYILRVDPEQFDLARFDRLLGEAQAAPARERAELLRAALALWRGSPLEDLAFEEFAQAEIAQLSERLLIAIESRIDADLELGAGAALVDELESLIAAHPLRERLRGQLMLALYRAGRQADALDAYREARRMLDEELGLEPGDELRMLERRILEQDPSLLPGVPVRMQTDSRRIVTVLFCDVVESTRLAMELDPEAYELLMSSYYDAARRALEAHGATVEKFIGDAVMGLFGVPERHEDDALRAVRAAVDLRSAVARIRSERDIRLRIAVNTGEVVVSQSRGARATGAAVNVAAHLERRADANGILLGEATYGLVRDGVRADQVELGEGLTAWQLDEVIAPAAPVARKPKTPLVGRKKELRRLRAAFQRARKENSCRIVTVVGEPGIGKTRLAREFVDSVRDDARILVGRCVSYGAGATYLPIAEIVRQVAPVATLDGIASLLWEDDDGRQVAQRIAEVVGMAEGPAAPGEAFWAIRRLVEAVARLRPVVVALDDVHWAEPTLLDLVEYLGHWAEGPILVVCLARSELLESRHGWGGPTSTGFVVELEPLGSEEVGRLLDEVAGGAVVPEVRERIVGHAGGNPLFAEQLLALAVEAPDVPLDQAPPTVEALIAARLDRLDPGELAVLRCASVIGRLFTVEELQDLGGFGDADLAAVGRKGFVHPLDFDPGYRFHHVLVRDVVYRGIPKARRAELHEQVADNLERRDGPDELVGYHLEQAYRCRVELARIDDRARRLATAAGERLGRAGIKAWKRADVPAAVNLLGRAVDLLPRDMSRRRELACELALATQMSGQSERAKQILSAAIDNSLEQKDRRLELRARIELGYIQALGDATAVTDLLELASSAIPTFETFSDDRSLGRAWLSVGLVKGNFQCEWQALEDAARRATQHYRRNGWSPSTCLNALGAALYYGPRFVEEAIVECEDVLMASAGDRASEANIFVWLGGLRGMLGRFEEGRANVARAKAVYEELGQALAAGETCGFVLGGISLLAEELERAEQALLESCETCMRLNQFAPLASRAAELADVLYRLARYDDAQEWLQISRRHASDEDLDAQSSWRSTQAKLLAQRGEGDRALVTARAAVDIADRTDALNHQAQARMDLAEVLRSCGGEREALQAVGGAVNLYELKGNRIAASRARSLLTGSPVA